MYSIIAIAIASGSVMGLAGVGSEQEPSVESFRRDVLLAAFDRNSNGNLDDDEVAAVRDAFGGIDVPMLPTEPYDYLTAHLPAHADPVEMERADNTPEDNPLTNAGAALGSVLFYDTQLSENNSIACASCHQQRVGFSDPRQYSVGFQGGRTARNAMGLATLRYSNLRGARPGFFWDERASTLEAQVLLPIQDRIEMGMELAALETKLQKLPYYPPLFEAAFGSNRITSDRIAKAVAQFMRSMTALDSKFDRAATTAARALQSRSASPAAPVGHLVYCTAFDDFTPQENMGKSLFIDGLLGVAEIGCAHCHIPPTFGMPKSFNNGLDLQSHDPGLGALGRPSNDPFTPSNEGKFKAPSLRNIELTAPYMHDGRFKTLDAVLDHYSGGVHPHPNIGLPFNERDRDREQATFGFQFTGEQKGALIAFLKTLTDREFVSEPKFSDPFLRGRKPVPVDKPHNVSAAATDGLVGAPAAGARADQEAEELDSAADHYQRLLDEYEAGEEPLELAERFFELAERYPTDPVAVDALVWILTKLRNRPEATRALERLAKDHVQSEKLAAACSQIARTPSRAAEKLLRAALEKNPHSDVRAQACLHLATLLDQQAAVLQQLKKDPASTDRVMQYYGKEYGKHLASLDPTQLENAREQTYELMLKSFADVKTRDTTMGQIAEKSLFQLRHLSIGRPAPEIEGEDIFGEEFKLSDYRGQVVVLSFWGHW